MSLTFTPITPLLHNYVLQHSLREAEILQALRAETQAKFSAYQMQTAPDQMQFLVLLANMLQAERILELGTFTGYSSLSFALGLSSKTHIITCDLDPIATDLAQAYWKKAEVRHRIELVIDDASTLLERLLKSGKQGSFDLIYIDADKQNIQYYYEQSLALIPAGGLIAVDNVLYHGEVLDPSGGSRSARAIHEFNVALYDDKRIDLSLLPIADGLSLIRKK